MVHQSPTSLQKDTNVEDRDFIPSTHGLKTCFHWPWIWGVCTNEADEARFVYLSTFAWFSSPPYWFSTYDSNAWSALWNHLWFCVSNWTSIGWCLCILKQLTSWCMILQFMFPLSYQLREITHDFKPTSLSLKTRFHSHDIVVYTPMEINLPLSVFLLDLLFNDVYVF